MSCLLNHLRMHSVPLRIALVPIVIAPNYSGEPWLRSFCIAAVRRSGEFVDGEAQWYSCECEVEAPLITNQPLKLSGAFKDTSSERWTEEEIDIHQEIH